MRTKTPSLNQIEPTPELADLPKGWRSGKIGAEFDSWGGCTPSTEKPSYWNGSIPWVSSQDVKKTRLADTIRKVTPLGVKDARLRVCPPGTVLVVMRSGVLAHTLPVTVTDVDAVVNQDIKAFGSSERSLNEWLALCLGAMERDILNENRKDGTTVQSIEWPQLKSLMIPIPPEGIRNRLLELVKAVRGHRAEAIERLSRASAILRRFRRSVLASACDGSLTEDWRSKNVQDELWSEKTLGDFLIEQRYGTSSKCGDKLASSWPVLRIPNIALGVLDWSSLKHAVLSKADQERLQLLSGDILVCRTNGSRELIGKAAMVDNLPSPTAYASYLIRLRLDAQSIRPAFALLCIQSPQGRNHFEFHAKCAAGQYNINQEIIATLPVSLPSIKEQDEIIRKVGDLLAMADRIESAIRAGSNRLTRAFQSTLAAAFRGELITNDRMDEQHG